MKKIKIFFTIIFIISLFLEASLFAQEKDKPTLGTIADNTHFEYAEQFFRIKEYNKALELYTEYIEIYLNGLHRKESYKRIATIYFDRFDYIKSIRVYKTLYEEFSNTDGVEAFFMIGICYQKMGYLDKAKQTFQSLIDEHPSSNYAYQAKIKLDLIEILENS